MAAGDRFFWDREERTLYIGPFNWPVRWTAYFTLPRAWIYVKRTHPSQVTNGRR